MEDTAKGRGSPSQMPLEASQVREWRHALQNAFLRGKPSFNGEDMDSLFDKLEANEDNIPADLLASSKIHKVMRHIVVLPSESIPGDDEFRFSERAKILERRWQSIRGAKAVLDSTRKEEVQDAVPRASATPVQPENTQKTRPIDNGEDQKEAQRVRKWRHDLQLYFLTDRINSLSSKDLLVIHKTFSAIEAYEKMTVSSLTYAKIPKVMRCIMALDTVPGDGDYNFRARAQALLATWTTLSNAKSPTATGPVPTELDNKESKPEATNEIEPEVKATMASQMESPQVDTEQPLPTTSHTDIAVIEDEKVPIVLQGEDKEETPAAPQDEAEEETSKVPQDESEGANIAVPHDEDEGATTAAPQGEDEPAKPQTPQVEAAAPEEEYTDSPAPEDTFEASAPVEVPAVNVPASAAKPAADTVASQMADAMEGIPLDSPPKKVPQETKPAQKKPTQEKKPKIEYPPKRNEVLEEDPWVLIEFGVTMTEAGA